MERLREKEIEKIKMKTQISDYLLAVEDVDGINLLPVIP